MPSKITKKTTLFGHNLGGVFMPAFNTTLKKMGSVPPVFLYFLEPVLQAEYQRFMPDSTTKFQQQKNGQRSACTSMFFGTGFAGRVPTHIRFRLSFY